MIKIIPSENLSDGIFYASAVRLNFHNN